MASHQIDNCSAFTGNEKLSGDSHSRIGHREFSAWARDIRDIVDPNEKLSTDCVERLLARFLEDLYWHITG